MDPSLPVRVVDFHPSAVYLGTVYTQDVALAVDGVPEFTVYDPNRLVSPDMVGTTRRVELDAFIADAEPSPDRTRGISLDRSGHPVFEGEVVALDDEREPPSGVLDVGVGTVAFGLAQFDGSVDVSDALRVIHATVHIVDVEGCRDSDAEYAFFVERLRDGELEQREQAARHLGGKGSERGVGPLINALSTDEAPEVRTEAATALGRIGMGPYAGEDERDPRIRTELERATDDPNSGVAEAARLALRDIEMAEESHMHSRDW